MKIYKDTNVFDEALNRIRYLFDEFPNVITGVSGGKDSTVIFHLSLQVAQEKHRLPLRILFIDQEAEWDATIEQMRQWMYHPDVEPKWYQIPFKIFNATSIKDHWLMCWNPDDEENWIRPKEDISIKTNIYGTDRFHKLFGAILDKEYPETKTCYIAGVRAEESPSRTCYLTSRNKETDMTYKGITWCSLRNKGKEHFTFYPIYDWSYTDIWKAIHDNQWPYNRIYDLMYCYGIPIQRMRVSNLHHETAVHSLFFMQEIEPENYDRLTQRIAGIDMAGKLGKDDYFVSELPFMFKDWFEYRDYLLEKLIDPKWQASFRAKFKQHDELYGKFIPVMMCRAHINAIMTNDWEFVKLHNFETTHLPYNIRMAKLGKWNKVWIRDGKLRG